MLILHLPGGLLEERVLPRVLRGGVHVQWLADGGLFLSNADRAARFDAQLELVAEPELPTGPKACSPDGRLIAVNGRTSLFPWELPAMTPLWQVDHELQRSETIAFSPDGRWLVTTTRGEGDHAWDARTGERLAEFARTEGEPFAARFTPDGSRLVLGGRSGRLRLFSVPDFEHLVTLRGHDDSIRDLAVSPDGEEIYTISGDHSFRTWSTTTTPQRWTERRERAALLEEAQALVSARLASGRSLADLAPEFIEDASLDSDLRRAAWQVAVGELLGTRSR